MRADRSAMIVSERNTGTPIRLYVLDTGLIECSDYAMFSPGAGPGVHQEMTVRSYLVVHPTGMLLCDTGIDDAIHGLEAGRQIMDAIAFRVPKTLGTQLEAIGVPPSQVDYLALSHLHIDHLGNLAPFRDATVLLQQAEYDAAYGPDPEAASLDPETYAALNRDRIRTVDGDHDVFGDGSVVLLALPGHTPGHQGLLVNLANTGPVLIAADTSYSAVDYAYSAVRTANVDLELSRLSIERVKQLERERSAIVWLHHDQAAQQAVALAPTYYD
jgi:glyoxylase-like metal-dependent hydrolase (beta-lactamase superfamily II)